MEGVEGFSCFQSTNYGGFVRCAHLRLQWLPHCVGSVCCELFVCVVYLQ